MNTNTQTDILYHERSGDSDVLWHEGEAETELRLPVWQKAMALTWLASPRPTHTHTTTAKKSGSGRMMGRDILQMARPPQSWQALRTHQRGACEKQAPAQTEPPSLQEFSLDIAITVLTWTDHNHRAHSRVKHLYMFSTLYRIFLEYISYRVQFHRWFRSGICLFWWCTEIICHVCLSSRCLSDLKANAVRVWATSVPPPRPQIQHILGSHSLTRVQRQPNNQKGRFKTSLYVFMATNKPSATYSWSEALPRLCISTVTRALFSKRPNLRWTWK